MTVLTTSRSKIIQSDSKATTAKTGEKMKISFGGGVHDLPVYKIPIKHLIYNIRNGRFSAELLAKDEPAARSVDYFNPKIRRSVKYITQVRTLRSGHKRGQSSRKSFSG